MANEHERVEICRLCGKQSQNCFSIFQDEDNILEKINTCLPIDISPDDKLPSNICRCCSYRLSISYKLRCTAVEVDERLRMQLHQRQSDDVYANKDTNNFSENFLNIKRQIIDEENVLRYQNDTQEIRDKININNNWKIKREDIDEISYEKEAVISTKDNETEASINLVTEIDIVEMKYEDVMGTLIEQTDNSSDFVKNEIVNDCQTFSEYKTLEQNEQLFYCHTCKIKFENERYFKDHIKIHEEITVICTTCSAKCSSTYDLFLHCKQKKHNIFKKIKQLKYACTKCNRLFAHSLTWENHNKSKCLNMTDKCCKYCKTKFTTHTKLILHLKKEHQNIHLEHKCNCCDAVFKEKLDLAEHIREIHNLQSSNKFNKKKKYVCKFCGKKFNSCRLWKNHERIHTGETLSSTCKKSFRSDRLKSHHVQREYKKEYVCDQCGKCFSSYYLKRQHAQREHKKEYHVCDQCGKCFSSYYLKRQHAQRKHKKEYVCDQCGKCFSSYHSKWQHTQVEHKKKEYVCDKCGKCFRLKNYLRSHILLHLPVEARKYQCDICQKKFLYNSFLTVHKRIHNGERSNRENFFCDYCGKCFSLKSSLRSHILSHLPVETRNHQCDICQKKFLFNSNLTDHKRIHSGERSNRENFLCDYCGKCFRIKKYLRAHISTHLPVEARKYQCDICQKKFLSNSHLTDHKSIHSEVRPYKCDLCSFSFKVMRKMKQHRKLHFKKENEHARNTLLKNTLLCNEENFVCDYCGKCFRIKKYLRAHISTHLPVEARKYQCDICQKKFIMNYHLTNHKRIHSKVQRYKCDVCSFTFKHLKSMKRHRKLHFKKEDEHAKNTLLRNML